MQRFNINWTAKALVNQMEKGKVNYDNAVQRNLVWDTEKKSLLIHSMIYGYAIPAMYFTRDENGVYDSLDGKQRSNAISEYLHDEFALTPDTPTVVDDNGCVEDVSGLYFSQLPEWARDRIKDYNLTIYYYEGMTETEIREFFRRLNNGKPFFAWINTKALPELRRLARENRFYGWSDLATIQSEDGAFMCQATPKGSYGEYLYIGCWEVNAEK